MWKRKEKGGREVGPGVIEGRERGEERGGEGRWEEEREWEGGEKGGRERTYIVHSTMVVFTTQYTSLYTHIHPVNY